MTPAAQEQLQFRLENIRRQAQIRSGPWRERADAIERLVAQGEAGADELVRLFVEAKWTYVNTLRDFVEAGRRGDHPETKPPLSVACEVDIATYEGLRCLGSPATTALVRRYEDSPPGSPERFWLLTCLLNVGDPAATALLRTVE